MLLNPPALEHLSLNLGVPKGPQASGGSLTPILVREDHTTCPAPESSPDRQTEKCEAGPRGVPQMNRLSHTCRLVFCLQLWAAEHLLEPRSHLFAARALTSEPVRVDQDSPSSGDTPLTRSLGGLCPVGPCGAPGQQSPCRPVAESSGLHQLIRAPSLQGLALIPPTLPARPGGQRQTVALGMRADTHPTELDLLRLMSEKTGGW